MQKSYEHIVNKLHPAMTEKASIIGEYNMKVKLFDKIDLSNLMKLIKNTIS